MAYFDHQITNAQVEGLVNKIKTLKRQADGYRDMEYFKLRLYHLHQSRYPLAKRPGRFAQSMYVVAFGYNCCMVACITFLSPTGEYGVQTLALKGGHFSYSST